MLDSPHPDSPPTWQLTTAEAVRCPQWQLLHIPADLPRARWARTKILHVENLAGVASTLAAAQRELGHEAHVLETWKLSVSYPHDYEFYYGNGFVEDLRLMRKAIRVGLDHDVVHVHGGIARRRLDLLWLGMRRPMLVEYHGSDVREGYGLHYRWLAKKKIVATPDLARRLPEAEFIPNPVAPMDPVFDVAEKPAVVHMPTVREKKGTQLIVSAVTELKKEGVDFNFDLIENVPRDEARRRLGRAHILIDQVVDEKTTGIPGLVGMTSLEAMAIGKAAVGHVDPDWLKWYPGMPIVNVAVDKEDLKKVLKRLVGDLQETQKIGLAGNEYIRKHHSPQVVTRRLVELYDSII